MLAILGTIAASVMITRRPPEVLGNVGLNITGAPVESYPDKNKYGWGSDIRTRNPFSARWDQYTTGPPGEFTIPSSIIDEQQYLKLYQEQLNDREGTNSYGDQKLIYPEIISYSGAWGPKVLKSIPFDPEFSEPMADVPWA